MQWSALLACCPTAEADALVNDLTVGFGGLAFMVRQLTRNGELAAVMATLDQAERALDRAYRRLALRPERDGLAAAAAVAAHQPWQDYLRARPHGDGVTLLIRLQDVVAEARVAGEVIAADGTVEEIERALRRALDHLGGLRREMTPPPPRPPAETDAAE